ncbi:MAG: hypothetical protein ACFFFC_09910 [Candidatus Thorarchaeota archaeon]
MNKRTILAAGIVVLFAMSAAAVFTSAVNALSATPCQEDSSKDSISVDRETVPKQMYRWVPIDIRDHEDNWSSEVANRGGGCDFCFYDFH